MTWWMWAVLGFFLLVCELLTPGGFYVMFLGVSGLGVALVTLLAPAIPLWGQWLLFSILGVVCLVFFRRPLLERFKQKWPATQVDNLVGETATALEDIAVNAFGKAELRGAAWNAQNTGATPVARSQRCQVERIDGLTLYIRGQ
jgi:membrane protein implicated in regulation of membrane protease activity